MELLLKHLKRHQKILALALVLATVNQVFSLLDPQIFRMIVDRYASKAGSIPPNAFLRGVLLLLAASVGVAFVSRVAKNFQDYFVNSVIQRTGAALYAQGVSHSFSLPYSVFEDQRSGELLQKLQKARSDAEKLITGFVNTIFLSLVGMAFVIIYAFWVHWLIGAVYFAMIPVLGAVTFVIGRRIRDIQKTIVAQTASLAGSTTETLRNVELVKSLGLEDQEIKRLNDVNSKILDLELQKTRIVRQLGFIQGTSINSMRALLLFMMLWLISAGGITLGQFFSLFIYSFFIFSPLGDLGTVSQQYQESRASMEALQHIMSSRPEPKPISPVAVPAISEIEFRDVSFQYPSGSYPALRNADFSVQNGGTVAFVGPSGSGKTTVMKLLLGLYRPTQGNIFVNGIDSLKISFQEFRNRIGLVAQETQLFAGTVRDNLLFVRPDASDDECLEVLDQAQALPIIERGGRGLETRIGEGGIKISGGERQRLAIARALLRNPELIIFDEATSSLDSITEKAITSTIREIGENRRDLMVVLVAHRLSTVAHADVIYVLEHGEIIEQGSHEELLSKGGLYEALWREQLASGAFAFD
jgi:ATP-binding cassette, subfamily B, bacterial